MVSPRYPRDLEQVVKFHGHFCGGILLGYRAVKVALERLGTRRAEDEEVVAVVENDSCAVDAVQVLAGCTFGKGNLIFRDYGKQVYTFALRPSGRAVRVSRKPGRHLTPEQVLSARVDELFWVDETTLKLPAPASIQESVTCERCGEPAMATRTRSRAGRTLCIPCASRGANREKRPPFRIPRHARHGAGA